MDDPIETPDTGPEPAGLWERLRTFTPARVAMDRAGDAIRTSALLKFQQDHALARDAIHQEIDFAGVRLEDGMRTLEVHSAAPDRTTYIRRPDLGRRLDEPGRAALRELRVPQRWDAVFVIADGLSSAAVKDHAADTLRECLARLAGWRVAPVIFARQARVALGDEIGELLAADLSVVLIGERPGLSVANSLGIYLTWQPRAGRRDSERNCISNIHAGGLDYRTAADKVHWLMTQARQRRLSGTALKEAAPAAAEHLAAGDPPPSRS